MLDGQVDGTFLVRLSSKNPAEPCTLSLRCVTSLLFFSAFPSLWLLCALGSFGGVTRHIHIHWDGVRYGLAEPLSFNSLDVSRSFPSLHAHLFLLFQSLCEYYKTEKLSGTITTTLKTPIKEARR